MKGKDEFNIVSEIAIVKWGQSYNAHLSRKARHWLHELQRSTWVSSKQKHAIHWEVQKNIKLNARYDWLGNY